MVKPMCVCTGPSNMTSPSHRSSHGRRVSINSWILRWMTLLEMCHTSCIAAKPNNAIKQHATSKKRSFGSTRLVNTARQRDGGAVFVEAKVVVKLPVAGAAGNCVPTEADA